MIGGREREGRCVESTSKRLSVHQRTRAHQRSLWRRFDGIAGLAQRRRAFSAGSLRGEKATLGFDGVRSDRVGDRLVLVSRAARSIPAGSRAAKPGDWPARAAAAVSYQPDTIFIRNAGANRYARARGKTTMGLRTAIALSLVFSGAGCGSTPSTCVKGAQTACACPGGTTGVQVCSADGTSFGSCQCGEPPDLAMGDSAVAPDAAVDQSLADQSSPDLSLVDQSMDTAAPRDMALIDLAHPDTAAVIDLPLMDLQGCGPIKGSVECGVMAI